MSALANSVEFVRFKQAFHSYPQSLPRSWMMAGVKHFKQHPVQQLSNLNGDS